jgi:anaerobic magnesium-protoporphyrin IX monomethyl ester cyclase
VRISLIRPVYKTTSYDPEVQEPLGIETLAGSLISHGHAVQVLDPLLTGQTERHTSRQVAAFHPDVVGFSLMSAGDLDSTNKMMDQIRTFDPAIQFVVGGNLVSTEPHTALENLPAGTVCIRYEGELPLLGIVDAIQDSRPLSKVGSVVIKNPNASIIETPILPSVDDLDDLPFALRPFPDSIHSRGLTVNLQASRGCEGTCVYCCAPGFPGAASGKRRNRSPGNIVDEIQAIVEEYQISTFNFVDDDFIGRGNGSIERMKIFQEEVTRRGLQISFGIQTCPSALDAESVQRLAKAGLSYVFFGLESDDSEVMRKWGRKQAATSISELVRNLRQHDIEAQAGSIMFHPESTLQSIRRLAQLLHANGLLNYRTATNRLKALPGSALYRTLEKAGRIEKNSSGPICPPFKDRILEGFYEALIHSLDPLRPVWVYAACKLPVVKAKSRLNQAGYIHKLIHLKRILFELEELIATNLFHLISCYENGNEKECKIAGMRDTAFRIGMQANQSLFRNGLIESEEILRNAVRMDCGI